MANLSNQQIKDTFYGLLNLNTATTGITSTPQAITDGLGNNTGVRIGTNFLSAPTIANLDCSLKPDMLGQGFGTSATAPVANSQNRLVYNIFYDTGVYSYSALSYNLNTVSTTSDVLDFYFYSLQLVPGYGVAPRNLIMSGISLPTTGATGVRTVTLPSTLSFSGTGGGYYVYAYYITNSGVTPTVRITTPTIAARNQAFAETLGYYMNAANTAAQLGSRIATITTTNAFVINTLSVQSSYSQSDIINNLSTTLAPAYGFGLRTI